MSVLKRDATRRMASGIMVHELKCWPEFFEAIMVGAKKHDLRRADDREFMVGDMIKLREYNPSTKKYSGREQLVEITYMTVGEAPCALSKQALHPNFCILSISLVQK
ncbi:MAG: DUF3850 domain-containing protein [Gemmatimonadota bacterium]|nr:DUF3850 domain-containing protein [Gemmatimonadota bacterium]